jgi:hypothetical protein
MSSSVSFGTKINTWSVPYSSFIRWIRFVTQKIDAGFDTSRKLSVVFDDDRRKQCEAIGNLSVSDLGVDELLLLRNWTLELLGRATEVADPKWNGFGGFISDVGYLAVIIQMNLVLSVGGVIPLEELRRAELRRISHGSAPPPES